MAYVKSYEHDVFLSYAHVDNVDDGARQRWVEAFGKQLSAKLLKRVGESVAVWWDPQLERSQVFDEVIRQAVQQSAIVVSLVSHAYVKRPYCQQELAWFAERGELQTAAARSRVFPVLLFDLPFDQWPDACRGVSGFEFYDAQADRPLDVESKEFSDRQWQLAAELARALEEIKSSDATAGTGGSASVAEFRVFLGDAPDELAADRSYLAKELRRHGVQVLDTVPPPYDREGHASAARQAIERADLAVHFLGNFAGKPIDEDDPERTFPVEQTRIGLELGQAQLVLQPEWFSSEAIRQPGYARFVQELEQRPRETGTLQIMKAGRAQMLDELLLARDRRLALLAQPEQALPGQGGTAFVDLHLKDMNLVGDLFEYLSQHRIEALTVPSTGLTPTAGMGSFEQHLKNANLFIIVFGGVALEWVRYRVAEAVKLIVHNGLSTRVGVYVAPPDKQPDALNFRYCDAVMLNTRNFDPATLEPLLSPGQKAGA